MKYTLELVLVVLLYFGLFANISANISVNISVTTLGRTFPLAASDYSWHPQAGRLQSRHEGETSKREIGIGKKKTKMTN